MGKRLTLMCTSFIFLFLLQVSIASAEETNGEKLNSDEIQTLIQDVGFNEDEIKDYPVDFLRSLIEQGATKKFHVKKRVYIDDPEKTNAENMMLSSQSTVIGDLEGHVEIIGSAYEVPDATLPSGWSKFRVWGRWNWESVPQNTWTDAFSVGWSSGEGLSIATDGYGGVAFHTHDYYVGSNGERRDYGVQPDDFTINGGVGVDIDLIQGYGSDHAGHIDQIAITNQSSGITNVSFEYGHSVFGVSPSFSTSKDGTFGIDPGWTNDTGKAIQTLSW
ncbi:hypothetical protein [Rossellomorea arthrocnemi]|uniref:hypothetical protein n=1 Tax=Rossellomorea arthrocnemi TaxID=2769542 RepID=UPI00191986A3|nr:hypothetical protein [Rossellomorea arthrocnemi]